MAGPATPHPSHAADPHAQDPRQRRRRASSPVRTGLVAVLSCLLGIALVVIAVVLWSIFGPQPGDGAGDQESNADPQSVVEAVEGASGPLQHTAEPPAAAD